jgi:hypothetical protein
MGSETQNSVTRKPKRALHQQYIPWPKTAPGSRPLLVEGLYPGEPETCRRSLLPFVRNLIYLALLLAVFRVYRIEERAFQGRAFQMAVTLALFALPIHYLAPFRFKKWLFVGVSTGGLFLIFGAHIASVVLGASADPMDCPRVFRRCGRSDIGDRPRISASFLWRRERCADCRIHVYV